MAVKTKSLSSGFRNTKLRELLEKGKALAYSTSHKCACSEVQEQELELHLIQVKSREARLLHIRTDKGQEKKK